MNDEELARRAVACKGWRWMDGMRALDGDRRCGFRLTENSGLPGHEGPVVDDSWTPDLADPATLGCLLALVREAWDIPEMGARGHNETCDEWVAAHCGGPITMPMPTEAAALVAALEAAP